MNIAVVGLGLIGGSFCKAVSNKTLHNCFGIDINEKNIASAVKDKAIVRGIQADELRHIDVSIICLYPRQTVDFILKNADNFMPGSIVIDCCGIKQYINDNVYSVLKEKNVTFIGCHPMAGREFSGYDYSLDTLFNNASFIAAPAEKTDINSLNIVEGLAKQLGFAKFVVTSAQEHDSIIAFTSQLAHVVSNSYVKSPTLSHQRGFSAGSFQDLTRVAKLNENLWADLFLLNKGPLLFEIDKIIDNLNDIKNAIANDEADTLKELLRRGTILKEQSL